MISPGILDAVCTKGQLNILWDRWDQKNRKCKERTETNSANSKLKVAPLWLWSILSPQAFKERWRHWFNCPMADYAEPPASKGIKELFSHHILAILLLLLQIITINSNCKNKSLKNSCDTYEPSNSIQNLIFSADYDLRRLIYVWLL